MDSASRDAELITRSKNTGPDTRKESKNKFSTNHRSLARFDHHGKVNQTLTIGYSDA